MSIQNDGQKIKFTKRDRLKLLAGGAALALSGCGSSGSNSPTIITPQPPQPSPPLPLPPTGFTPTVGQLRDTFTGNFEIGAAIQVNQIDTDTADSQILKDQFNSITAEFQMKPEIIAPTEGAYDWSAPDAFLSFTEANNMVVRGHALLWHRATPDYFFQGTPAEVRARLEDYIIRVVSRYRGRIFAWDVVNEAITDDDGAADPYRRSNWWNASGGNADYIDWAFNAARAADPDCKLFLNEYNTELAGKRGRFNQVVSDLVARNIPLDGVGHQMHINVDTPASEVFAAIDSIDNLFLGLDQHVTELDISYYSDPGSCFATQTNCDADYGNNVPTSIIQRQAELYRAIFNGFVTRPSLTSVTTWGVSDAQSWLNDFPVTRTNAPLLWDRDREGKTALGAILDPDFEL